VAQHGLAAEVLHPVEVLARAYGALAPSSLSLVP
jgi:hypothetical protein